MAALGLCVAAVLATDWMPEIETTPQVVVSATAVTVDGAEVLALTAGEVPEETQFGSLVGDLYDPLLALHGQADALSVRVEADVPTDTMMSVVFTARQAGFETIDVAVDGA